MKLCYLCGEMKKRGTTPCGIVPLMRENLYICVGACQLLGVILLLAAGTGTAVATLGTLASRTCRTLFIAFGLLDECAV